MSFDFKNKNVGITGAAGIHGIGFAIAKMFLKCGANVFICDLRKEALDEAAAELKKIWNCQSLCD